MSPESDNSSKQLDCRSGNQMVGHHCVQNALKHLITGPENKWPIPNGQYQMAVGIVGQFVFRTGNRMAM
jgi:hypothetical protein